MLTMAPFTPMETKSMIMNYLGVVEVDDRMLDHVFGQSQGQPDKVERMLQLLAQRQELMDEAPEGVPLHVVRRQSVIEPGRAIDGRPPQLSVDVNAPPAEMEDLSQLPILPESDAVAFNRLQQLSGHQRLLLRVASIVGERFAKEPLQALLDALKAELAHTLSTRDFQWLERAAASVSTELDVLVNQHLLNFEPLMGAYAFVSHADHEQIYSDDATELVRKVAHRLLAEVRARIIVRDSLGGCAPHAAPRSTLSVSPIMTRSLWPRTGGGPTTARCTRSTHWCWPTARCSTMPTPKPSSCSSRPPRCWSPTSSPRAGPCARSATWSTA
jgi:hypothetical protein